MAHLHRIANLFSGRGTSRNHHMRRMTSRFLCLSGTSHEKNLSAQRPEAQPHSRFPFTNGHQGWSSSIKPSPRQRSQASVRIEQQIWAARKLTPEFGKAKRLLNAKDYGRVFDGPDVRASHQHLLLLAKFNDGPGHRLGLVIAKKNVRLAVHRNRIKRVAREIFRTLPSSEPPMDVVLLARRGLGQLDNAALSSILLQQWQKLVRHTTKTIPSTSQDS